jgi:hypothetical protein
MEERSGRAYLKNEYIENLRDYASELEQGARKNYFLKMIAEWLALMSPALLITAILVVMASLVLQCSLLYPKNHGLSSGISLPAYLLQQ